MSNCSAIVLSSSGYWREIESIVTSGNMPAALADVLKELVNSHLFQTIPPEAKPNVVNLAKLYLQDGIEISDSVGEYLYDVMVFVPNPPAPSKRSFFRLVPKYPGGQLKHLSDL